MHGSSWRTRVAGLAVPVVAVGALAGCLQGPGEFEPATPTSATAAPVGTARAATVDIDPCGLLDADTIAQATGETLERAPLDLPTADAHTAGLTGCRWADEDGHEVSVMIDPTITDIDAFYAQASADADAAGEPVTALAIDGADLAFGGESDDFAAVAVVIAGVVHQVLYAAPSDDDRLAAAQELARAVVAAEAE
ncbi:DUF3558 family protein [Demequina sp. NBRC 110057]|uniref:DUF3558 family protein n=1 Tax=Demequina sp. NBRC 110057 TaxID=1570346 RepID=UPI0011774AA0|nr:DUF3558 family protein [Demequina sp. NBRC 110057]